MRTDYDIAIVGGGLGGLSLAILLAKQNIKVILLEKNSYPFHKVCGEYISNESRDFVDKLGVNLAELGVSEINRLTITTPRGKQLHSPLDLGGFGISRYRLDASLADIAKNEGVKLMSSTRVDDVVYKHDYFEVSYGSETFTTKLVVGAYGKRANLDVKLKRPFATTKNKPIDNYVGVKYHVGFDSFPDNMIELHNFKDGYCGMSAIENDAYCICYLTTAANLQAAGSIKQLENTILKANPFLAERLNDATHLFAEPVTISQINFKAKKAVEQHILMLGDAAGTIAPLCGNGMSMSMHAALLLSNYIGQYLKNSITRAQLEQQYQQKWNQQFNNRIVAGYYLQKLMGNMRMTDISIGLLSKLPTISKRLIKLTHGDVY